MVELVFGRTDSGSTATILVGDSIVVCVHDGPAGSRWTLEDCGLLAPAGIERVEADAGTPAERRLRFRATTAGESSLRLALRAENARVLDTLSLVIDAHERPPSSALRLLRKKR